MSRRKGGSGGVWGSSASGRGLRVCAERLEGVAGLVRSGVVRTRGSLGVGEAEHVVGALERSLSAGSVGTLPGVAARVIQMCGDPEVSLKELVGVVKSDPALAAKVLGLVNSAYFGQRKPVTDLQRAGVLLGLGRLKALALGFHLARSASGEGCSEAARRGWAFGLYRAWAGFHAAEVVCPGVSGEAFVVGLLCDAGEALMGELLPGGVPAGVSGEVDPQRRYELELGALPFTHVDVVVALGRVWGLPEMLRVAMAEHHGGAGSGLCVDGSCEERGVEAAGLVEVGRFAGSLVLSGGVVGGVGGGVGGASLAAAGALGLEGAALERVLGAAATDYGGTASMFEPLVDGSVRAEDLAMAAHAHLSAWAAGEVESSIKRESWGGAAERLWVGRHVYEVERLGSGMVRVFISERTGRKLISEQVEPERQGEPEIRDLLLLGGAGEAEAEAVMSSIRRLAA